MDRNDRPQGSWTPEPITCRPERQVILRPIDKIPAQQGEVRDTGRQRGWTCLWSGVAGRDRKAVCKRHALEKGGSGRGATWTLPDHTRASQVNTTINMAR